MEPVLTSSNKENLALLQEVSSAPRAEPPDQRGPAPSPTPRPRIVGERFAKPDDVADDVEGVPKNVLDINRRRRRLADRNVRVVDQILDALEEAGIDCVFGLPGKSVAPIHNALLDRPSIKSITTRHENIAVFAAAGYALATGKVGVALVTSGPGVLNAMNALASAYCDGLPVLLLVGEISRAIHGKGAFQDGSSHHLNILAITRPVSKMAMEIPHVNTAKTLVRRALCTARSGKMGPVVLTLPLDILSGSAPKPTLSLNVKSQFAIDPVVLQRVQQELSHSKRGVIFAGSGTRHGTGPERLCELAERLRWPVMTTPKAKGIFPESHPLSLGVFGMGGHPSTQEYLSEGVETVLAIGTSLGDLATDGWSDLLNPSRAFIHVDIEAGQTGRSYPTNLTVTAPAEMFLGHLTWRLAQSQANRSFGISYHQNPELNPTGSEGRITPQRAIWEIQQVMPNNTIYVVDSGAHYFYATHYLRTNQTDGYIVMTGLGSMGSSIGASLGAKLGKPHRPVAVICGDGGFAMSGADVSTANAANAAVIYFVFDDQRLGMVEMGHAALHGRSPAFSTGPFDVEGFAAALGAQTHVVKQPGDLLNAGELFLRPERPLVVDILIDRTVGIPQNDRFTALRDSA
ncbi:MAG: thiamine pyrophosphate-binding protein [Myxococcota bacterium]